MKRRSPALLVLTCGLVLLFAMAGWAQETEPNNDFGTADGLTLEILLDATVSPTDTVDFFEFDADSTKMYTLHSVSPARDVNLRSDVVLELNIIFEGDLGDTVVTSVDGRYERWGFRLSGWVPPRTGKYFAIVNAQSPPATELSYQVRLGYGTPLSVATMHEPDNSVAEAEQLPAFPTDGSRVNGYLYNDYSDSEVSDINWNDIDHYKIWGDAGTTIIAETFTAGPDSMIRDTDSEIALLDSNGVETGLSDDDKVANEADPWEDLLGFNNTFSRMEGGPLPYTGWYYVRVNSYYNSVTRNIAPTRSPRDPGGGEYELSVRFEAGTMESEPNNTFQTASLVDLEKLLGATVSPTDTVDVFKFEADSTKMYSMHSVSPARDVNLRSDVVLDLNIFFEGDLGDTLVTNVDGRYERWGFRLSGWVPPRTGTYFAVVSAQAPPANEIDYQVRLGYGTPLSVATMHEPDNSVAEAEQLPAFPTDGSRANGYLYNDYSDSEVSNINWNDIDHYKVWGDAGSTIIAETFTAGPDSMIRDTDSEIALLDSNGVETGLADDDKVATEDDPWEDLLGFNNTFSRMEGGPLPYSGWYYIRVNSYYNSVTRTIAATRSPRDPGGGEYELSVRMVAAEGETEPNDTFVTANRLDLNMLLDATVSPTDTADVFKFEADSTKMYTMHSISPARDVNLRADVVLELNIFFEGDLGDTVVTNVDGRYERWGFRLSGWVPPRTGTYYARVTAESPPASEIAYQVRLGYGTPLSVALTHEPDNTVAEAEQLPAFPTDGTKVNGYLYNNFSDSEVSNINWNDIDHFKIWGEAGQQLIAETFTAGPDTMIRDSDTEITLLDSAGVETGLSDDDKVATEDDPWEDFLGVNNTFSRMQGGPLPYTGWYYVRVNSYYNSVTRAQSPASSPRNPGGGEYLLSVQLAQGQENEPNNTADNASMMLREALINATVSPTDTVDFFSFYADSTKMYTMHSISPARDVNLRSDVVLDLNIFFEGDPGDTVVTNVDGRYERWGFRLSGWVPPRTGTYFAKVSAQAPPATEIAYQVRLGYGTPLGVAANTHEPDNTVAEASLLAATPTDGIKFRGYLYNSYSDTAVTNINWNDIDHFKIWGDAGTFLTVETFTAGPDSMIRDTDSEIALLDSNGVATGLEDDDKVATEDDPWEDLLGFNNTFSRMQGGPLPYTGWYYIRVNSYYNSVTRNISPTRSPRDPGGGEYRLQIRVDGATSVADADAGLPRTFDLLQNYPNPFNPETTINYQLPQDSDVKITVFNMLGQKVATLVDKQQTAGRYSVVWDGRNVRGLSVATGVYFYRMQAKDFVKSVKMLLIK